MRASGRVHTYAIRVFGVVQCGARFGLGRVSDDGRSRGRATEGVGQRGQMGVLELWDAVSGDASIARGGGQWLTLGEFPRHCSERLVLAGRFGGSGRWCGSGRRATSRLTS